MRQKFTQWFSLLAVVFMLAAYCSTAQAALQAVGPLDAVNGFPTWYRDATTRALQPCLSLTLLASGNQGCVLPAQPPFYDPFLAMSFPGNYPFEVFYFIADSNATTMTPTPALGTPLDSFVYRAALEATFSTPTVVAGGQITFARIRMRMDAPKAGTYTITHPYGVETFNVITPGIKAINLTRDIGIAPYPTGPLAGDIGPFLTQIGYPVTVAGPNGPETFIGDFNVPGPVTGSPNGTNFIKIVGPVGADLGFGSNTYTTTAFAVSGKVYTGQIASPLTIDRATYARDSATSSQVDVFVTALPAATTAISGPTVASTNLTQDPLVPGKFFIHLPTTTLPTGLNITDSLDIPPILHPVTPVDEVNITQAMYRTDNHTLTIKAASRDKVTPPTLTVPALAAPNPPVPLVAGTLTQVLPAGSSPPMTVTVNSSAGGSATAPVSIVTPPALPVALDDTATTVGATPVLINVVGNDTAAGIIDLASVVTAGAVNGNAVANLNGTVTFTPVAVAPASFTYTVKDSFGQISNIATVTVTVNSPAPVTPPVVTATAPLAITDTATTAPGTAVRIPVLSNDIAGAASTLVPASVLVTPTPDPVLTGTAVVNTVDGSVTFTPAAGVVVGPLTFSYTVANSSGLVSPPVNVTVNLIANTPPVANPDSASTFVNTARIISVLANDTDVNGNATIDPTTVAPGAVSLNGVPTLNFTLTPGTTAGTLSFSAPAAGTYTFPYTVKDTAGATSNSATVTVTVSNPVTDSVTVLKAEYVTIGSQWLVEGTTTNMTSTPRTVTIHLGSDLTGQIIGTVADVGGKWKFQTSASGVVANATNRTISVAIPSGAARLAFPVVVK